MKNDVFTQTDENESFPLPENNVDENLVSVPYYVDEFENMSDSESATLDLKITAVNADERLKSIVSNLIEWEDSTMNLVHIKMMFKMKMMINSHHICCTDIDRCDIFRANANRICEETKMYVYEKKWHAENLI